MTLLLCYKAELCPMFMARLFSRVIQTFKNLCESRSQRDYLPLKCYPLVNKGFCVLPKNMLMKGPTVFKLSKTSKRTPTILLQKRIYLKPMHADKVSCVYLISHEHVFTMRLLLDNV